MCSDDIQIVLGNIESTRHAPRVQNLKITSEFLNTEQAVSDFISIEDYQLFLASHWESSCLQSWENPF